MGCSKIVTRPVAIPSQQNLTSVNRWEVVCGTEGWGHTGNHAAFNLIVGIFFAYVHLVIINNSNWNSESQDEERETQNGGEEKK